MCQNRRDAMLAYRSRCVAADLDVLAKIVPGRLGGVPNITLEYAAALLREFAARLTPAPISAAVDAPASGAGVPQ